jgi:hypothetical protein
LSIKRLMAAPGDERQQQTQCIAVAKLRLTRQITFDNEVLKEETADPRTQQRGVIHDPPPVPVPRQGSGTGEVAFGLLRLDIGDGNITHRLAEGLQDGSFGAETRPHRLLECDIILNELGQIHSSPPKSNRATSRSPGRSTLA